MKRAIIFSIAFLSLGIFTCKKDDSINCSAVSGAKFTSNSGMVSNLLATKCGNSNCHSQGAEGAEHWYYIPNYDSLTRHFDHFYEAIILESKMPPDTSIQLTDEELNIIKCWKVNGFPE